MGNILYSKRRKKNYRYDSYHNSSFERLLSHNYDNDSIYESYKVSERYRSYKVFERYETVYETKYERRKKVNKLRKLLKKKKRRKKFTWRRINSSDFSDSDSESLSTSDVEISYLDYYDLTRK
jgi:lipopolysaccharide export LptBFGC system permease protein LptF